MRKSQHLQGRKHTIVIWNKQWPLHIPWVHANRQFLFLAVPWKGGGEPCFAFMESFKWSWGKLSTCGTNHTTMTSRAVPPPCPNARQQERQKRGRNAAGGEHSTAEVPAVKRKTSCQAQWQLMCSQPPWRVSLLSPAANGAALAPVPAVRAPPGPIQPARHETGPLTLPRGFFTKAELDFWSAAKHFLSSYNWLFSSSGKVWIQY